MTMRIERLEPTEKNAALWDAFVDQHPDATSDHWWGWRQVLSGTFGFEPYYLAAFNDQRQLDGILPLFKIPRGFGRCALSSIPYGNYGGICASSVEASDALLDTAKVLAQELRARYVDLRHRKPLPVPNLQRQWLYSRFTLPLTGDLKQHAQAAGQNNRKKISKARRSGLRVVYSRDVSLLYPIHLHTARRLGTPCFPYRYFESILETFGDRAQIAFVAKDSSMVAYDVNLFFKDSLIIQLGGALKSYSAYYPNNFLFWDAIEQGCARQLKLLDYCRNRSDSGSAHFKRSLHLTETPLAYQFYLPPGSTMPQRHPSNPKYSLVINAWKQLPLRLTQWCGPTLVRYLA